MKKIAKLFAATLFALSVCVAANAQDLAQAGELYNNAATALNGGDKAGALEGFQKALDMATMEEPRMKDVWSTKGSL